MAKKAKKTEPGPDPASKAEKVPLPTMHIVRVPSGGSPPDVLSFTSLEAGLERLAELLQDSADGKFDGWLFPFNGYRVMFSKPRPRHSFMIGNKEFSAETAEGVQFSDGTVGHPKVMNILPRAQTRIVDQIDEPDIEVAPTEVTDDSEENEDA